jgi:hypothetical protein
VGSHRFDDVADALLYLDPSDRLEQESAAAEAFESSYRRELDRRSWIEWVIRRARERSCIFNQ